MEILVVEMLEGLSVEFNPLVFKPIVILARVFGSVPQVQMSARLFIYNRSAHSGTVLRAPEALERFFYVFAWHIKVNNHAE